VDEDGRSARQHLTHLEKAKLLHLVRLALEHGFQASPQHEEKVGAALALN
jgi:hypothetical protein